MRSIAPERMPAIGDSSPLILFARTARLDLLRAVFSEIVVPPAVWSEIVVEGEGRPGADEVKQASWIRQQMLPRRDPALSDLADLGPGEAEVIALAAEMEEPGPLLLDDRKARRVARGYGFSVIGSAGVLVLAKNLDLITGVRPALADPRDAGLYFSDREARELLDIVGE